MNKRTATTKPGTKKSTPAADPKAAWGKKNPKADTKHEKLSPQAIATAKRRARNAGHPYPNLVDNMSAAAGPKK